MELEAISNKNIEYEDFTFVKWNGHANKYVMAMFYYLGRCAVKIWNG